MTLEDVVRIVYDTLNEPDIQTHQAYPGLTIKKIELIRETYIEHLAFPELPIRSIVWRRITGFITEEESAFWARQLARQRYERD